MTRTETNSALHWNSSIDGGPRIELPPKRPHAAERNVSPTPRRRRWPVRGLHFSSLPPPMNSANTPRRPPPPPPRPRRPRRPCPPGAPKNIPLLLLLSFSRWQRNDDVGLGRPFPLFCLDLMLPARRGMPSRSESRRSALSRSHLRRAFCSGNRFYDEPIAALNCKKVSSSSSSVGVCVICLSSKPPPLDLMRRTRATLTNMAPIDSTHTLAGQRRVGPGRAARAAQVDGCDRKRPRGDEKSNLRNYVKACCSPPPPRCNLAVTSGVNDREADEKRGIKRGAMTAMTNGTRLAVEGAKKRRRKREVEVCMWNKWGEKASECK